MKHLFILLLSLPSLVFAAPVLGDQAVISVLTCSPGDELYSVFGHSAIRVYEPNRIDYVYNYGTFQFSDDFYLQFAQGKLNYRLSRTDFQTFNYEYIVTGRGVWEQVLDLDSLQAQNLFDFLEVNYLPENRYYLYDFFYDNCATRIRDVLDDVLGENLVYESNFAPDSATFRNMIDMYLVGMPWADFGIDLALGAPCDYKVQEQQNMFLPDFVFSELARAKLNSRPLVRETHEILPPQFVLEKAAVNMPIWIAALVAMVFLLKLFLSVKRKQLVVWPDRVLMIVIGLIGVAVALLWFATDHVTTPKNYNLVWAFPTHLIAAFYLQKLSGFWRGYFRFFSVVGILFALTSWLWPQELHPASYLLGVAVMAVCLRAGFFSSQKRA